MDGVGADEFGLGLGILVLEYEGYDLDEVVVELVERVGMGVCTRKRGDVSDILSGGGTALDDGGESAHC